MYQLLVPRHWVQAPNLRSYKQLCENKLKLRQPNLVLRWPNFRSEMSELRRIIQGVVVKSWWYMLSTSSSTRSRLKSASSSSSFSSYLLDKLYSSWYFLKLIINISFYFILVSFLLISFYVLFILIFFLFCLVYSFNKIWNTILIKLLIEC